MRSCAFCAIARGEAPAAILLDDADVVAFLDRAPLIHGHTLVITREHHATLDDVPPALLAPLARAAQRLSIAMQHALGADGSFTAVNTRVSQSVPHVHVHVVPRREGDGLFRAGMVWVRKRYGAGEAEKLAARVRAAL